jgi:2'-5' RNA ligase
MFYEKIKYLKPKLGEYLLIISPDDEVSSAITKFKKIHKDVYSCIYSANLKPHITLSNFVQNAAMENTIIRRLENFSKTILPFDIYLNGFGFFSNQTSTTYMNIEKEYPIIELVNGVKTRYRSLLQFDEELKPYFASKPHITIARGMTQEQFSRSLKDWSNKKFSCKFHAHEMLLLKRDFTGGNYAVVKCFPFNPNATQIVQLSLFN